MPIYLEALDADIYQLNEVFRPCLPINIGWFISCYIYLRVSLVTPMRDEEWFYREILTWSPLWKNRGIPRVYIMSVDDISGVDKGEASQTYLPKESALTVVRNNLNPLLENPVSLLW